MKDSTKNLLRWVVLLPASLLGGVLAKLLFHFILYSSLTNGRIISGFNIEPLAYYILPFIVWLTYILIGYEIAPKYKFKTCIILASLWLIIPLTLFIFMRDQVAFDFDKIGGAIGLFIVWNKSRDNS
jgi:hypothetical protein